MESIDIRSILIAQAVKSELSSEVRRLENELEILQACYKKDTEELSDNYYEESGINENLTDKLLSLKEQIRNEDVFFHSILSKLRSCEKENAELAQNVELLPCKPTCVSSFTQTEPLLKEKGTKVQSGRRKKVFKRMIKSLKPRSNRIQPFIPSSTYPKITSLPPLISRRV